MSQIAQVVQLYEELLANKDNTIPTVNQKIIKAKVNKNTAFTVSYLSEEVKKLPSMSSQDLLSLLHDTVHEFKSN